MKGMVLAAGLGTRLHPVTATLPKPMVPICHRPLIGWAIESLLGAGVDEIVVNLRHLPDTIVSFVSETYGGRARLTFSEEEKILGTGGGLARVRHHFEREETFLLLNGDTLQNAPLRDLIDRRNSTDAISALLLRPRARGSSYSAVEFDGNRVHGFRSQRDDPWMFAGVHALSSRILERIPEEGPSDIVRDAYQPILAGTKEEIVGVPWEGVWHDIGTPDRYLAASLDVLAAILSGLVQPPSGSMLRGTTIVTESTVVEGEAAKSIIGERSRIGRDSAIQESVVWDDCEIGEGCRIEKAVLAHGTKLRSGSRLRNVMVCRVSDEMERVDGMRRVGDLVAVPINDSAAMLIDCE